MFLVIECSYAKVKTKNSMKLVFLWAIISVLFKLCNHNFCKAVKEIGFC